MKRADHEGLVSRAAPLGNSVYCFPQRFLRPAMLVEINEKS